MKVKKELIVVGNILEDFRMKQPKDKAIMIKEQWLHKFQMLKVKLEKDR